MCYVPPGKLARPGRQAQPPTADDLHVPRATETKHGIPVTKDANTTHSLDSDADSNHHVPISKLIYFPVKFGGMLVNALIDSGCNTNLLSKTLYNAIPAEYKSDIKNLESDGKVKLANGQSVCILGSASIHASFPSGRHRLNVYVMSNLSSPMILGTSYLHSKSVNLDFGNKTYSVGNVKLRPRKELMIPANTEVFRWVKVSQKVPIGQQGVCLPSDEVLGMGLLVAKSLVTVSVDHTVPLKILNLTNTDIVLGRNMVVAKLQPIDPDLYDVTNFGIPKQEGLMADPNGLRIQCTAAQKVMENSEEFDKFISYFHFSQSNLTDEQRTELKECLFQYKDVFVTPENPDIGYTDLVQHKIHLKPDAKPKHHPPYRLPPQKREALRAQLDDLLRQGIIVPVSESEDLPITSPIVLVTKQNKISGDSDRSSISYRLACDYRYLNSHTKDFNYRIPDLQELTESFSEHKPVYMTKLDMTSGFFSVWP